MQCLIILACSFFLSAHGGTITVVDAGTNKPMIGAAIVAQSDRNGAYQFTGGVRPGDYRMLALSGLYEPERWDGETAAKFAIRGVDVNLGAGSSRTLDLEVAAAR